MQKKSCPIAWATGFSCRGSRFYPSLVRWASNIFKLFSWQMKYYEMVLTCPKGKLKSILFAPWYSTLTITEEDQLQNVRVIHRYSSTSNLATRVLQIRMFNGYCICQIKRPIYCTAVGIHGLKIQLPSWRHEYQTVVAIIKDETDISDLSTWKQEVVERTQCILGQVVDLQ